METKSWNTLYGAIIGDICGSIYEFNNFKTDKPEKINLINDECYFTDDTVCTAAIADSVKPLLEYMQPPCPNSAEGLNGQLRNRLEIDYGIALWNWGNKYPEPERSYGSRFWQWLQDPERKPYGSYGNGAAMRISPIAWLLFEHYRQNPPGSMMGQEFRVSCYDKILRREVEEATKPSHGHPEGIKGAHAVAWACFTAWCGREKELIREDITRRFGYDLSKTLADIRPNYGFDETCQGTVPVAIIAFLESHDFVSAIQNAISVGGDSDTIAAITGSIAEAYYKEIPEDLIQFVRERLTDDILVALTL